MNHFKCIIFIVIRTSAFSNSLSPTPRITYSTPPVVANMKCFPVVHLCHALCNSLRPKKSEKLPLSYRAKLPVSNAQYFRATN